MKDVLLLRYMFFNLTQHLNKTLKYRECTANEKVGRLGLGVYVHSSAHVIGRSEMTWVEAWVLLIGQTMVLFFHSECTHYIKF